MKKILLLAACCICSLAAFSQSVRVKFTTSYGSFTVMLYDETPKHRDMFLDEIKKGTYTNALFNRVIKDFVIQGGELDDSILLKEKQHPELGAPRFPAEIKPDLFHKPGALGAGRDDNWEKASFFDQIYFVIGRKYTDQELEIIEAKKGWKIPESHKEVYRTIGGIPRLDGDYTIFGQITEGLDVVKKINQVATDKNDVPLQPVAFSVKVMRK
ncbi:peptidylprolyl isomerase [Chitinophaga sp. Cy-1792]|uniref:peptidylprolyl isomerase n=1 Tax=Chitinophaga sp. Cy-1792 TaxID=2608339 RepID=UPI00141FB34C|nr:peptidylprolyl isomerase [Chitinophaga sp. Cy-1792]NIG57552.1 peptidylprolyl isomerase [Chitinophaga sp. Cy-1792]